MYVVKRCAIAPFVTLAVQATANKKKTAEERIFMHRLFMSRIMKIFFEGQYQLIPKQLMRKVGYREFVDPRTGKVSYVRTLRPGNYYPRFHAYLYLKDNGFQVHLHLDQKQPSYRGTSAHAGEYDGAVVARECARITHGIEQMKMK